MPASGRQTRTTRCRKRRAQQRIGVGADRIERDVAEIEQAGEADHDVEAPAEHHVGQHRGCRGRADSGVRRRAPARSTAKDQKRGRQQPAQRSRPCTAPSVAGTCGTADGCRPEDQRLDKKRPTNTAATRIASSPNAWSVRSCAGRPCSVRRPIMSENRPSATSAPAIARPSAEGDASDRARRCAASAR